MTKKHPGAYWKLAIALSMTCIAGCSNSTTKKSVPPDQGVSKDDQSNRSEVSSLLIIDTVVDLEKHQITGTIEMPEVMKGFSIRIEKLRDKERLFKSGSVLMINFQKTEGGTDAPCKTLVLNLDQISSIEDTQEGDSKRVLYRHE